VTRVFDSLPAPIVATAREGAWAPALVFGIHILASRVYGWYGPYPDLDIPMHFAGGVAIAWFIHRAAVNAARARWLAPFHGVTHVVLVLALAASSTVVWEFAEFLSDRYLGTHAQGGLLDTLLDMALGCAGGVALVLWLTWRARARSVSLEHIGASRPRSELGSPAPQ
jgi:hypothetical protein